MAKATISQAKRPLEIQTTLGENVLGLRRMLVQERLGRPFAIEVDLSSEDPDIKFDDLIGHPVVIRLDLPSGGRRFWHAFVARFQMVGMTARYYDYRASLVPWIWVMSRGADFRVFQKQNVPDIVQDVFRQRGAKDFETRLSWKYDPWEYCVQYRETDLNFVSRLMEQEGITYYFKHEEEKGTLVLADDKAAYDLVPGYEKIPYRPSIGSEPQQEAIRSWIIEHELQPTQYSVNDYNPLEPAAGLKQLAQVPRDHAAADRQIFDYPGEYETPAQGETVARIRLEELQAGWQTLRAETNCMGLYAGCLFSLTDHPRAEQNREHLVTAMQLQYDAGDFDSDNVTPRFSCSFTAIPSEIPYRPPRVTPKPVVQGPQSAVVVGPKGEEIHTDEHGRVKVHFFWDRESKGDENSSCWIRVAQSSAGKKWGSFFIPRIGHEVLVEFLEGDPDRPVITGSVYNGANVPPYELPANKTRSTLKSSTSKGGEGFNELRFEDKKDSEEIHLHAERNLTVRVKANQITAIGYERHETVEKKVITHFKDEHHLKVTKDEFTLHEADTHATIKGSRHEKVEGAENLRVGGDRMTQIGGGENLTVEGDRMTEVKGTDHLKVNADLAVQADGKVTFKAGADFFAKAGGTMGLDAGGDIHIKAGKAIVLEAGSQISLKVGGSFVDIGPSGVAILGPMVKVNSGGSAGSGGGCSPLSPAGPAAPDEPDPKDPAKPPSGKPGEITKFSAAAEVLKYAALTGLPFCEECPREQPPPPPPPAEVDTETPEIVSVALVDGEAEVASGNQWVNLPAEDKWVDADQGITSKNRLGPKLKIKVTFRPPGAHAFKLRLVPGDDNVTYTDAEKGRNAAFKFQDQEKSYTTGGDGTKVIEPGDFFVPSAGGQTFKLEAENPATRTIVETGEIATKRLGYVVPLPMEGMDAGALGLAALYAEFERLGLKLVELPLVRIPRQPNIGSDAETNTFKNACKAAFNGSRGNDRKPYALAIGFTEHLAVKKPNVDLVLTGWPVGPAADGGMTAPIPVEATGLRDGDTALRSRALWRNLVPGEGWFVSARYEPDGGGAHIDIPEASITPVPASASRPDPAYAIDVDTSALPAGTGTIRVRVNVVDRMRAGIAFDGNLACACLKAWWRDIPAGEVGWALIHEIGHKVGMVTDGSGKKPDKVPTHYVARGHVGDHCHNGLPLSDSFSGVTTGNICVMFGSITNQGQFCPDCSTAVKKMDLSTGWPPS